MKKLLETSEVVVSMVGGMVGHEDALNIMREAAEKDAVEVYNQAISDEKSENQAQELAQSEYETSLTRQRVIFNDAEENRLEKAKEGELDAILESVPKEVRDGVLKIAESVASVAAKAGKTDKKRKELGDAAYLKSVRVQCEQIVRTLKEKAAKNVKKEPVVSKELTVEEKKAAKDKVIRDERAFYEKQNPAKLVLGAFGNIDDKDARAAFEKLPGLFKGEKEVEVRSYVKTKTGFVIVAHGTRSGMKKVTV